jgi:hypothetical protein
LLLRVPLIPETKIRSLFSANILLIPLIEVLIVVVPLIEVLRRRQRSLVEVLMAVEGGLVTSAVGSVVPPVPPSSPSSSPISIPHLPLKVVNGCNR